MNAITILQQINARRLLYILGILFIISAFIKNGDIIERVAAFSIGCLLLIQGYLS